MFNINMNSPMYDPAAVQPMRDELVYVGFSELKTPEEVDQAIGVNNDETTLVFINSVCGCAAGSARPGISMALQGKIIPDNIVTVFAGQEKAAVNSVRTKYLSKYPPSSPSAALIKNGEVLFMLPRHHIEGRSPEQLSDILQQVFNEHCKKVGPSISKEKYDKLIHAKMCGSKIPLNEDN
ncbi:MAG: BrxA/BrxB family bacilliredoxin [Melioribacteraceae bacterium]|nr:BrxA/BrxB family bacilliredoxin [Melioribacteraceae bacterium]